jgi:hypothetical protein
MAIEVVVSVNICVLLVTLVWGSFTGRSGIGEVSSEHVALGMLFSVISAIGSSANIIYMKRLSDAGCGPGLVLATRFFLIVVVAWFLVTLEGHAELGRS